MSEIKFSCPTCQQHIQCDASYSGTQIQCPSCGTEMLVPGEPAPPSPSVPAEEACPSCNALLPLDAVLCTSCGYNLKTGLRMPMRSSASSSKGKREKKTRLGAGSPKEKRFTSPWASTGVLALTFFILFFLGLFFLAAKESGSITIFFIGLASIYVFGIHIVVTVYAFKNEGIGWALLCFFVPCGALYYVYFRSENETLQILYSLGIALNIAIRLMDRALS